MNSGNNYKVVFDDGRIERVYGKWAAHAWANARAIWPEREIRSFSLIEQSSRDADESIASNPEAAA